MDQAGDFSVLVRLYAGVAAGMISLVAYVPYILSIIRKETKPSRATWLILTGVVTLTLITSFLSGSRNTLWVVVGDLVGVLLIAILSMRYGVGGRDPLDIVCFSGVVIALLLWWLFESAVVGLTAMLVVDFLAVIPTVVKSYYFPEQEDKLSWTLYLLGHFISILAIEQWVVGVAIYPIYHTLSSGVIVILLLRSPKVSISPTVEAT